MQALDELSQNLHTLLERYAALQQENAALREDIEKRDEFGRDGRRGYEANQCAYRTGG